jgi:hypothetical protein
MRRHYAHMEDSADRLAARVERYSCILPLAQGAITPPGLARGEQGAQAG